MVVLGAFVGVLYVREESNKRLAEVGAARLEAERARKAEEGKREAPRNQEEALRLPACPASSTTTTWTNCVGEQNLPAGRKYVGEFKDGKFHGQGVFTSPSGQKYVGEFSDGKFSGQGTYTYPSGQKYVGEFKFSHYNGQGTLTLSDSSKYVGGFRDDKYHGRGIEYRADGSVLRSGNWVDGNFVERPRTDERAGAEAERVKKETDEKAKAKVEALRKDEEAKRKTELAAKAKAESEEKAKADAAKKVEEAPPVATKRGSAFRDCEGCPEMVVIPAGSFLMGSPASEEGRRDSEGPQHQVSISRPFAAGKYEVTFDEWDACVRESRCSQNTPDQGWGTGRRPVINVSWQDAKRFAEWLSRKTGKRYRLLTEAEWEYVARAGTATAYSTGATIATSQAIYSGTQTVPVGSYGPNAFGLHDVHGNVWEWTEDCWNANYSGAPTNGSAWLSGDCSVRVYRGGSWGGGPHVVRSAIRIRRTTDNRSNGLGFRLARDLEATDGKAKAESKSTTNLPSVAQLSTPSRVEDRDPPRLSAERAETDFRRAVELLNKGLASEAEEPLAAALKKDPSHVAARQALVALQIEKRQIDNARRLLQEGLAINPAQSAFAIALARIYLEKRDYDAALAALQATAGIPANNAEFEAMRGTVLQRLGRHRDAAEAFQSALRTQPSSPHAWIGLGISLEALGQRAEAADAFRKSLAAGPLSVELKNFAEKRIEALQ